MIMAYLILITMFATLILYWVTNWIIISTLQVVNFLEMEKPSVRLFTQLFQHILLNYSKDITKWVCGKLFVVIFAWTIFVLLSKKAIHQNHRGWQLDNGAVWQITMNVSLYHGYELSTIFCLGRMTNLLNRRVIIKACQFCATALIVTTWNIVFVLFPLQKCIWKNLGPAKPQFPSSKLKNIYQTFCWEREDIQELQRHWCARKVATRGWCPCSSRCNQTLTLGKDNYFFYP